MSSPIPCQTYIRLYSLGKHVQHCMLHSYQTNKIIIPRYIYLLQRRNSSGYNRRTSPGSFANSLAKGSKCCISHFQIENLHETPFKKIQLHCREYFNPPMVQSFWLTYLARVGGCQPRLLNLNHFLSDLLLIVAL